MSTDKVDNNAQEYIDRVSQYRGLPEIKKGDKCEVDGRSGIIVDGNSSCNFNVMNKQTRTKIPAGAYGS